MSFRKIISFLSFPARMLFKYFFSTSVHVPISNFDKNTPLPYEKLLKNLEIVKARLDYPLTLTEKIIFSHLLNPNQEIKNANYFEVKADRLAMDDFSGQIPMLQFISSGLCKVAIPTTVHSDHLIRLVNGNDEDLVDSLIENKEIFDFLESASRKFGIGFWKPGSGIMHQVLLENYVFPGLLMLGTDCYMATGGGLGALCVQVRGSEAVDAMAGMPLVFKCPKIVGVKLMGRLRGWASPKDLILKILGLLSSKGGVGIVFEFFGPGLDSLSCMGMATISNMSAEMASVSSIFSFHKSMENYMKATQREDLVIEANKYSETLLTPDKGCKYYELIQINLNTLEPHVSGPLAPVVANLVNHIGMTARHCGCPTKIKAALVGSASNCSLEDMIRCSCIATQALARGIRSKVPFYVTPGTEQIRASMERDGITDTLKKFGAKILPCACGPSVGQWTRKDVSLYEKNAILISYSNNTGRLIDGGKATYAFVSSPEIVTAFCITGRLDINPINKYLTDSNGRNFKLKPPKFEQFSGRRLEPVNTSYYVNPTNSKVDKLIVNLSPQKRKLMEPFPKWDGKDFVDHLILIKIKGRCVINHISATEPWLKYRGHLENFSNDMFAGAVNEENNIINWIRNRLTHELIDEWGTVLDIARHYKGNEFKWVIIAEENYGKSEIGEYAAFETRYLGGSAVIVKSIAPIHEMDLKRQGLLPLTFVNPNDYDKIKSDDKISLLGLRNLTPGKFVHCVTKHKYGGVENIKLNHTMTSREIEWFKAGSSLNRMKEIKGIEESYLEMTSTNTVTLG